MELALGIHSLVPGAEYFGSLTDNTKESFDNLIWLDDRAKPTLAEIVTAEEARLVEEANKVSQKAELLNRLGITEEEAQLLLS